MVKLLTVNARKLILFKFFSEKSVEISGTTVTNIYGGFIDMTDGVHQSKVLRTQLQVYLVRPGKSETRLMHSLLRTFHILLKKVRV